MTSVLLRSEMRNFPRAAVRRYVLVLYLPDTIPETRVSMRSERTSFGQAYDRRAVAKINSTGLTINRDSDVTQKNFKI